MKINQEVWQEFILWAKVVLHENPEATIYDLFMRIREENGNQPFSENFLKQVDYDVAAEVKREKKKQAKKDIEELKRTHTAPYPECVKYGCELHPFIM